MEAWTIRVVYFLLFSFLVSARFASCAPYSEEGRALQRYRERERDKSTGSLSNWREGKVIGRVLNLIVHNATPRKLLQSREQISNKTQTHHKKQSTDPVQSSAPHLLPHWAIYILPIAGVLFVAIVATAIYLLFSRRKKDNTVIPWVTGLSGPLKKAFVTGVPSLERIELEAACEGFINVIGTLPECTLYKGTLSSGVEIAVLSTSVNSAKQWSARSEEKFRNKILVLSKVNHKNYMNLLGYCGCDEPFTRMMVFEYAPCGSLFEHLHIREAEHLDWKTRLRIIMGVAYCLEHMSQLHPPPLLPTNLTSSSIYLAEDYAAKIADIEFWKDDNKQDPTAASREINQESVIVYKFGILVLEVISGRRPISEDDRLLVLWASSYLDGKRPLSAMPDRTLVRSSSAAPEKDVAALCDVVRLCVRPEAGKRAISMGEVAKLVRGVARLSPEQAAPRENPLWWAELEIASAASETG